MTKYHYPTWADILGSTYKTHENWAEAGAGNHFIFNSVIECNKRNVFNADDTVIIMWTTVARLDFYQHNKWTSVRQKFPDDIAIVPCPVGYELASYAYFDAIAELLESKNINYKFVSWTEYDIDQDSLYTSTLNNMQHMAFERNKIKYISVLDLPKESNDLYNSIAGRDWPSLSAILNNNVPDTCNKYILKEIREFRKKLSKIKKLGLLTKPMTDTHPTPIGHLNATTNFFKDVTISQQVIDWVCDIDHKLINSKNYTFNANTPLRY